MTQENFEPKWFRHVPDPVYQLMHPSKCCWCLCAIPTGAAVIAVMSLLGGLSQISGSVAELTYANNGAVFNMSAGDFPAFRQHKRFPSGSTGEFALATNAWDISANVLGMQATSPTHTRPTGVDPSFPNSQDQEFMQASHLVPPSPAGYVVTGMEGALQATSGALALPGVFCGGSAKGLKRSAELLFLISFVFPVLTFVVQVARGSFASQFFGAGINALLSFIFGVHYAGVVYQFSRILHVRETGSTAGDIAGADLVPPPNPHMDGRRQGGGPDSEGGTSASAPAVRVHTSGVAPSSGL